MEDDLAKRLRSMRGMLDLTQSALAERVGITQAYLAELEKGVKRPSIDVLEKLCGSLNCSADYLLGLSESRSHQPIHEESLPSGLARRGISPDLLRVMAERHISGRELALALDFVKTMQDENAKK